VFLSFLTLPYCIHSCARNGESFARTLDDSFSVIPRNLSTEHGYLDCFFNIHEARLFVFPCQLNRPGSRQSERFRPFCRAFAIPEANHSLIHEQMQWLHYRRLHRSRVWWGRPQYALSFFIVQQGM
jgi:hypothetical protein